MRQCAALISGSPEITTPALPARRPMTRTCSLSRYRRPIWAPRSTISTGSRRSPVARQPSERDTMVLSASSLMAAAPGYHRRAALPTVAAAGNDVVSARASPLALGGHGAVWMGAMQNIHPTAWIAPSAQLFGSVAVGEGASVWHNAVMRAERHDIRIGRMTNIQDFVMIHADAQVVRIGEFCSVAHHVTVHACTVDDHCLIGIGATLMDGAVIGRGSIVAGGAFVTEGTIVPPGSIVAGLPAKVIRQRDSARENRLNAWRYHRNAACYRRGEYRAWDGHEYEAWLAAKRAEVDRDADLT